MTFPTELTVSIRPQNVPSRPRKHQKAGHVAGDVTRLVEAGGDRVENAAHQLRRHGHAADATAEDCRHWRKQHWRPVDGEAGVGEAEIVDPGDLRIKPQHLPERQNDADRLDADDQRVQARDWP